MKTTKFIYKISIILILCALVNACWKPVNVKIDQETKDYCLFAEGSYWIYQDSVTLKIDSVFIKSEPEHMLSSRGEQYRLGISSSLQDTLIFDIRLTTAHTENNVILMDHFDKTYYHDGTIGDNVRLLVLSEIRNNYILNGITYSKVKIFKFSDKEIEKVFYWVQYIGLIREETYINDTAIVRNLLKYNVKPYKERKK